MGASVYVLEGAWDKPHEAPQILPYLAAYEQSHGEVRMYHRTFRNASDIEYYLRRIPTGARAFVYVACHGEVGRLDPSDAASRMPASEVQDVLKSAKRESVSFLHFGCCEFVQPAKGSRRAFLDALAKNIAGGLWVSGYTREVDWLASTLLDLALISEVYVPWFKKPSHVAAAHKRADAFMQRYSQLARALGFSALSGIKGTKVLFPARVT